MALPALTPEWEKPPVDERAARFEADIEYLRRDVGEIKAHLLRVDEKIDDLNKGLSAKIDSVRDSAIVWRIETKDSIAALSLQMEMGFAKLTRWTLFLYIGMGITMLGVIARAMKWV